MKLKRTNLLFILLVVLLGFAAWLEWDFNDPNEGVAGYRVHWGDQSRTYNAVADVGYTNRFNIDWVLNDQTVFMAVTAYDQIGLESDFSDEIWYTRTARPQVRVNVSGPGMIERSTTLTNWEPFIPVPPGVPAAYYLNISPTQAYEFFRFVPTNSGSGTNVTAE